MYGVSGGARVISARGQDNVLAPLPGGVLSVFGRFNERGGGGGGAVRFRPIQRAGGGGGCCPLTTACGKKSIFGQKGG